MKKILSVLMSVVMLFSVIAISLPTAFAADTVCYYIDSIDGDDTTGEGTLAKPWKTINNLGGVPIVAGVNILFRCGGTYECAATLTTSGTKENPIVISSYGEGEKPLLTTNEATEVLRLFDCSYITVSNLEITAPNGGGIWIDTLNETSYGITIDNVEFHDIQDYHLPARDNTSAGAAVARCCIMVKGLPARSRYAVNDLTITNCEMYDCGNGINVWGSWNDSQTPWCETEEEIDPVYNTGLLVKGCYFHDMDSEAIIVGMCDGALVTHCRSIDCCQGSGVDENGEPTYFTAAMWFWGSENSIIQYCEIAGQKNFGDGMSVDFDSHTNNCTYQYIYSHDNMRFMCNNANYSGQHNNTVRYCLSVNDGGGRSKTSSSAGEYGFKFYNNTIIGCGEFQVTSLYDSVFANNIIIPKDGEKIYFEFDHIIGSGTDFSNNCYYNCPKPIFDIISSKNTVPGFVGGEGYEAYQLVADSPLIGKGKVIEDDLTTDFFGNEITSNNIGCYAGDGEDGEYDREWLVEKIIRFFRQLFNIIKREINYLKNEAK
ncbi:MAG: hypothetical protein IJC13_06030 [Clostridia bacterium]|nr:hypothetical protein [Clostridia bacterium]